MKYQDKASFKKANYFGTGIPNFMLKGNMTGTSYINRTYAVGIPKNLRKSALILTSGSPEVYGPAVSQYNMIFNDYMHLTDMGSILVHG